MEIQIEELIAQIKKDGVDEAEARAAEILEKANAEAEKILSDARVKAEKIIADAKSERERFVKSGEDALRQAGRNLLISFRESIAREISVIVNNNVNSVFSSDAFAEIIINTVKCWAEKPDANELSVVLNSDELEKLEAVLKLELKAKLLEGVTLKPDNNFDGGFRITANGSGVYYDYSVEAVTDMLSSYLSPKITALLKEAE